jgi:L-lactate dehydrogenase
MGQRYAAASLVEFAVYLLLAAGMEEEKARVTAEVLVEGDLLGHTTHGLALLGAYLKEIANGSMARSGEPRVVADAPAAVVWDGMLLPGPWLIVKAIDLAMQRASALGTCTVIIHRSHHTAALAAYLRRVTEQGKMIIISCTDPAVASVAPFGGRTAVYAPNPIAAGWPTDGDPVMIDTSMSITSLGTVNRLREQGKRLPGAWLLDADGRPSDDPAVLKTDPPGSQLPIGGFDHGHKGYALGLLVEAMTHLGGFGRADAVKGWSNSVFVQVLDPQRFGGASNFIRQMTSLSDACHASAPADGVAAVRLPGERGLRLREDQLQRGVELSASIVESFQPWAEKLGVKMPKAC